MFYCTIHYLYDILSKLCRYRPAEVGHLHSKFSKHYYEIFVNIVISSVRNFAASNFAVDHFRYNRTHTEQEFHKLLKAKLEGTYSQSSDNDISKYHQIIYSRPSLSRLRISQITAYLEEKIRSLF